jgi:hypothetical protein
VKWLEPCAMIQDQIGVCKTQCVTSFKRSLGFDY